MEFFGSRVSPSSTGILWTKVPPGGPKGIPKRGRWALPILAFALGISSRRACPCDRWCVWSQPHQVPACLPGLRTWPSVALGKFCASLAPASFCQVSELATWAAFWHL